MATRGSHDAAGFFGSAREMIHLDTSFLIGIVAPKSTEYVRLRQWVQTGTEVKTNAISWGEFVCGPVTPHQLMIARYIIEEPLPFTRVEAERAADLFNATGRRRGSFVDCMIAASALVVGASIATLNRDHFVRFRPAGLQLEPL